MDHFKSIYSSMASQYQRMIAAEDADSNLPAILHQLANWSDARVLDVGTGTGRFPQILRAVPTRFIGLDVYRPMLLENRRIRQSLGGNWPLVQADMRQLPFAADTFDIALAGWSIGHLRAWHPETWRAEINRILHEMNRTVKTGGMLIICETMSTGSLVPRPPTPELAQYFEWLEQVHNFSVEIVPTDYQFRNVEEAVEYTEFFFGSELAEQIRENGWARLPEWTGIWYTTARML